MKISCLIVDDEHSAREGLRILLEDYPAIEVVGVCKNGMEAIDEIQALRPDLVLLDIQMPQINGFEVLASISKPRPQIIFITAHDEFAVRAFDINALDYLLKPFTDERFDQAIQKALTNIRLAKTQNLDKLSAIGSPVSPNEPRLTIKVDGVIHRVPFSEICYIEAFDYYVKVHLSAHCHLVRDTMKNMESELKTDQFLRIHKSYIANLNYVSALHKTNSSEYELELRNGDKLKVSRSKISQIKQWLQAR